MKTKIHVNQHRIRANRVAGTRDPVITVKDYKQNRYGNTVIIKDTEGNGVARIVYRPDAPLSCGAVCWIETVSDVEVLC